uniref:Uncharacterized protein n=1 Tax=Acrobeloides nanus TaxID=290746 RepID=A0A914E1Z0_9BILA
MDKNNAKGMALRNRRVTKSKKEVAEEGIERLHWTICDDIENVSRRNEEERAKITLQRWSVQVQLADIGKSSD